MGLLRSVSRGVALTGAVVAGGALVVTARSVLATPQPLESALEGESHIFRFREGDIFYKVSGPTGAQPVLLLHSTHLSASSFEWRRNFSALSQEFRVYAPDLLGFGLSDRPAIDYTANTYVTFISDFAREVIGQPGLLVARGQSAAFSTRAAYLDRSLFSRLIFISPTGIAANTGQPEVQATGAADGQEEPGGAIEALRGLLRRVSKSTAGEVPYAFLTTKTALSLFIARQSYVHSEQVTPDLVRHLFATTHQHGARFAPLAFMTGKLDLPVASDFARLQQPALLVWGEQDTINEPLHAEALRRLNPRARLELISNAGNAVQEEQSNEMNELLRAWFLAPAELVDPTRQQHERPPEPPASRVVPPRPPNEGVSAPERARPTAPLPTAAPTTPLPEKAQPAPPAQSAAEQPDTHAPRAGEAEAAPLPVVAAPTEAAPPPAREDSAAMESSVPAATSQAPLPLPGEPPPRADEAILLAPSAALAPTETAQPTDQAAEEARAAQDTAAASIEEQSIQAGARERPTGARLAEPGEAKRAGPEAGDLMTELEAQTATEMQSQLPAAQPGAAPLPEPATPEAAPATDAQQASPQQAGTTTTPATRPPTRAAPRQPAAPKAAASRAPRTSGGQPPAHHEPHHPAQGGGKSPGSRPSGGKKKK